MKVSWKEHRTNEDILCMVQEERSLMSTIRNRQKNWLGHVLRGNSLMQIASEGIMVGQKTIGRPRVMLLDWMLDKRNWSINT